MILNLQYYYSIKEISVGGRCVCNGHAYVCPPLEDSPDLLACQCQHNTAGTNCDKCADGFVQKPWRPFTKDDPYECEPCNCNGHSDKCHYEEAIADAGKSMDIHGNYEGGGVCDECQHNTEGINCDTCIFGFFRPEGVPANATDPCQPCACSEDPRYSGNCAPGGGQCECKEAFRGADDCSACADGYHSYPDCLPCDCFANGTVLMENGLPFCVAEGQLQCPCLENFNGTFCDECAEGYFGFPDCNPCECNSIGSLNQVCNAADGQCQCKSNYAGRQCDQCHNGYYYYPSCDACDCDPQGTTETICDAATGQCLCKEGFGGARCDKCLPGWFDYPNCNPCQCSDVGSTSEICDVNTGQCPCENNYGDRQCDKCSAGFFSYPDCLDCACDRLGSKGSSCDDNGQCSCLDNFVGLKCDTCAPERYNYPLCEPCNCNPDGVTEDFFAIGGCDSVPEGSLCTCKDNVMGRICDTCKPLFWNLQPYHEQGCIDCQCHRPGTIGGLGTCDTLDGQCACKGNVNGDRTCNQCKDGFFGLNANNGLGCQHCQCDPGGTDIPADQGQMPVCDKETGMCACRPGLTGRRCNQVSDNFYVPTMHQFKYEIEDGYRADASPVRIGYDDAKFPGYSWRGYGSYSQLQDEVLLDVDVQSQSSYRFVIRYTNPNPTPIIGEVEMIAEDGTSIVRQVLLQPTGGQPAFVTVSGDKGIYPSPFDLMPGKYVTSVKIPNTDPEADEILVDYFVLLPHEYYEPSILKEEVYEPCLAGQVLPYCRHYSYPDLASFPKTYSDNAERPGGGAGYAWSDDPQILAELGTSQLASIAKWQPELEYPIDLKEPGKHVLAVAFFTPNPGVSANASTELAISANDNDGNQGKAYIFDCRFSTLCRQVVTDAEGRVQSFDFPSDQALVTLKSDDPNINIGIDSVIAIPLEDWSLDWVTPNGQCIRKNGECIAADFPNAPEESVVVPFNADQDGSRPEGIIDDDANPFYADDTQPIPVLHGKVPQPGLYVLVAQYYQPDKPHFQLPMNISYAANAGEDPDIETLLANGQFYEAVLPLPTCRSNSGCRSVINKEDNAQEFNLNEAFHIQTLNPEGHPVWLESITAIPSVDYTEDFLKSEPVDGALDYARQCGLDHFNIDPNEELCKAAVITLASAFNNGALECQCDSIGSLDDLCDKIGGQCSCKDNIIGRQCTRCKPGFFGYPDCKQCNCPPTAQCNEENGECICAPHVTGTDDNPCSQCEENTFGYDPITGCQECMCIPEGTVNGNMSCNLESGACFCKDNVVGRTCDRCQAGYYQFPDCSQCPCDLRGTTQDICNQETAECMCKPNVIGDLCDTCKDGTFDLQEMNPDGCTDCVCSGKTLFCQSHDRLVRTQIQSMENWKMTAFQVGKTLAEKKPGQANDLPNYSGELAVSFTAYPDISMDSHTLYFKAPEDFLRNQIKSYGGFLSYSVTYSGYNMDGSAQAPDVLLTGNGVSLLYHSGQPIRPNEEMKVKAPFDPYYWVLPSGAPIDRPQLMVALTNLTGLYIRASYGLDSDGQARLSGVSLDSAVEVPGERNMTEQDLADQVTSVELCQCPEGYYGYSCEDCDIGYYRSQEGPLGPICTKCNCNNHADTCHPLTGECVSLTFNPQSAPITIPDNDEVEEICHFRPDLCLIEEGHCLHNTTGSHCENCAQGFYGDPTAGTENDCSSCPCPLQEASNNFAISCDALLQGATEDYCICQPNYVGGRCEHCGPGYFGEPETPGDYCKPCQCNGNIDVSDAEACDRVSGLCMKCLDHTFGDSCERCEPWFYGDAINVKNCQECRCNQTGTEICDHMTGQCTCHPGVEGSLCDRCQADHWGFDSGDPGCSDCQCSEASYDTQCDLKTGQCSCKVGVTGQKCDRCAAGYWNLGPDGCESCGCNLEYAVGGTCDPVTGQCECLRGVTGQNCDRCPTHWVLVVNETRTEAPAWKAPFDYTEGCFPCSTCVSDLLVMAETLNSTLVPVLDDLGGVNSSYLATRKLENVNAIVDALIPEIDLMNPDEGKRRLEPLENQVTQLQQNVKSLNVDYKLNVMAELDQRAAELGDQASMTLEDMGKVNVQIIATTNEMKEIADGLGSGVTRDLINTSITYGNSMLDQMKANDFSEDRAAARDKERVARELVKKVKKFADPVDNFKGNVLVEEDRIEKLQEKLDDLKSNSENSIDKLAVAKRLNFRNSDPEAGNKAAEIRQKLAASEGNIKLGKELNNLANGYLDSASQAFQQLDQVDQGIEQELNDLNEKVEQDQQGIATNAELLREAMDHANDLESKSTVVKNEVATAKSPATLAIEAANAYSTISSALQNASSSAEMALQVSTEAASIVSLLQSQLARRYLLFLSLV